ncbi:glycoside hydrolase family 19 protein [Cupriavidus agavae]|uniref:Putative chitinase n=1 Tax=Cupriavidus agavae TaxID=1001822 RepID=A0A4V2FI74_9BURK|nr:hypothetical protein [Cupriavidus agavae]RZT42789.1 putative chitinase [Cupriavidus agavae]
MLISPPFLPDTDPVSNDPACTDPMMDVVDRFALGNHGVYPIAMDGRWHCGTHLAPHPSTEAVRAIADGEVVAYRVAAKPVSDGREAPDGSLPLNTNTGFVLLRHKTDTGDGRSITFYSLYMHLLDMRAQEAIHAQPANPPAVGSGSALPRWLLRPTEGVKIGDGKLKVYRKDMLGYRGRRHGHPHLHFEIFLTDADFDAYFGRTQLGRAEPVTPAGADCWGRMYYVIPGEQEFVSTPPGKASASYFPELQTGSLAAGSTLHVEVFFHLGQRYTRSWIEINGQRTLLTPTPVKDPYDDYEYNLFRRATALYPRCPSAGYELLRFGRVLSPELPALTATESQTWVAVTFDAEGNQGYLDISRAEIQKLSDADFPRFTGWQKIEEGRPPFTADGVCDHQALRQIVETVESAMTPEQRLLPADQQAEQLTAYIHGNEAVRDQLKGFVCHAPSEWDKGNNTQRYGRLNEPEGFFGKRKAIDPDGYSKFIGLVERLQFLEQVPGLGGGQKFWFFHPLAFIRHFRRCGWLSVRELTQTLPRRSSPEAGGHIPWQRAYTRWTEGAGSPKSMPPGIGMAMNRMWLKYGFTTPLRQAHFLSQIFKETGALTLTTEGGGERYFRTMYEVITPEEAGDDYDTKLPWLKKMGLLKNRDRAAYSAGRPDDVSDKAIELGNTEEGDGARFRGRGLIHLTGRQKYTDYQKFAGKDFTADANSTLISAQAKFCTDSAGYFWTSKFMNSKNSGAYRGGFNIHRRTDLGSGYKNVLAITKAVNGGANGLSERFEYFQHAYYLMGDKKSSSNPETRQLEPSE